MTNLVPVMITPPTNRPVTLDEAKAALKVEHNDDDALIDAFIDAAVSHLDGYSGILGQALLTQTWRQDFSCFAKRLRLPFGPASAVVSLTYYDADNELQTLSSSVYCLLSDVRGPFVQLQYGQSWPSHVSRDDAISVSFTVGRSDDLLPPAIRAALLMLVGHFYENRGFDADGSKVTLPRSVDALLAPHRRVGV